MPKKAKHESQAKQSERFRKDAQKLIDAGGLNPTEGEMALDSILRRQNKQNAESEGSSSGAGKGPTS